MMEPLGIKLVDHGKLVNQIFLPKPTLFQVIECQSNDRVEGVYSVPINQWYKSKKHCYDWWGGVFKIAKIYKIKVEVKYVTEQSYCGFRFHEPESSYIPNYKGTPDCKFDEMRQEALAKDKNIQEIQRNYNILMKVIAGAIPLTPDFYNHILYILGEGYSCMETQYFGIDPEPFPIGSYLFYYGRLKGLHPWDLADAGLLSVNAAYDFRWLESIIESAEELDRLESIAKTSTFEKMLETWEEIDLERFEPNNYT